jgi:hypothetical protein
VLPVHCPQKLDMRTSDYFRSAVTNRMDSITSIVRRTRYPEVDAERNEHETTELIKEYLFDKYTPKVDDKSEPWPNKDPWHQNLNGKMFYL